MSDISPAFDPHDDVATHNTVRLWSSYCWLRIACGIILHPFLPYYSVESFQTPLYPLRRKYPSARIFLILLELCVLPMNSNFVSALSHVFFLVYMGFSALLSRRSPPTVFFLGVTWVILFKLLTFFETHNEFYLLGVRRSRCPSESLLRAAVQLAGGDGQHTYQVRQEGGQGISGSARHLRFRVLRPQQVRNGAFLLPAQAFWYRQYAPPLCPNVDPPNGAMVRVSQLRVLVWILSLSSR